MTAIFIITGILFAGIGIGLAIIGADQAWNHHDSDPFECLIDLAVGGILIFAAFTLLSKALP